MPCALKRYEPGPTVPAGQLSNRVSPAGIRVPDNRVPRDAFSQVRQHRPLRSERLDRAAELGNRDDGDVELFGEGLDAPRDLAELLRAVLRPLVRLDHLDVVDHDQPQTVLGLELA